MNKFHVEFKFNCFEISLLVFTSEKSTSGKIANRSILFISFWRIHEISSIWKLQQFRILLHFILSKIQGRAGGYKKYINNLLSTKRGQTISFKEELCFCPSILYIKNLQNLTTWHKWWSSFIYIKPRQAGCQIHSEPIISFFHLYISHYCPIPSEPMYD